MEQNLNGTVVAQGMTFLATHTMTSPDGVPMIGLSLEIEPRMISVFAMPYLDATSMLHGLIESLAGHGDPDAMMLLGLLSEEAEANIEDGSEEYEGEDFEEDDESYYVDFDEESSADDFGFGYESEDPSTDH